MSKIWLIALRHFREQVFKRSFIITLLSLPAFLTLSIGMGFLFESLETESTVVGVVDEAQLLVERLPLPEDVELVELAATESARAALDEGRIDAYFVVNADYPATGHSEYVFYERPPYAAQRYFDDLLRVNLLGGQPPQVAERAVAGAALTVRATDSGREYPDSGPSAGMFAPLIAAALISFLVLTVSGTLAEAVAAEKINRTIEVVITSVSPATLMTGKIIAVAGVALTLLAVWLLFFAGAAWIGIQVMQVAWLQELHIVWSDLGALALIGLPAFLSVAAIMVILGSMVIDARESQQIGPFFFLILFFPMYLLVPLSQNPNGLLARALTLFPLTSVTTFAVRTLFVPVAGWEVFAAAGIALLFALFLVWLAGKAFRLGMLRYGQRLRLRELIGPSADGLSQS